MKISLYVDLYPGMEGHTVFASSAPGKKIKNVKRIKVNVTLPDVYEPDVEVEGLVEPNVD